RRRYAVRVVFIGRVRVDGLG
ncbi:hypothetical protein NO2_1634, partial [Candidatus Termititenax persephonae]